MEINSDSCPSTHFPVTHKSITVDIKEIPSTICTFITATGFTVIGYDPAAKLDNVGNKTDIVICKYDDNFLVMVTQIGCMGTILRARKEESVSVDPTFNVSVVFGRRDEPYLLACARQLIEHISSCGSSRPLVLSLGLKDHSPGTLKDVISVVIDNRLW